MQGSLKLFLVLILLSVTILDPAKAQLRFGVQVGTHGAVYNGILPDSLRFRPDLGVAYGLRLEYQFSEDVALSINPQGVNEQVKLQRLDRRTKKYEDSVTFTTTYISVPVLVQIISDNRKFRYLAGVDIGFPNTVKSTGKVQEEQERSDVLKDFNLAASFGIGWQKKINKSLVTIDLLYNQGLLNLTGNIPSEPWYSQLKANAVKLTFGYSFDIGKKGRSNE